MRRFTLPARLAVLVGLVPLGVACASGSVDDRVCGASISVSGFVADLALGLDNRSPDQYAQFRADTEDVLAVVSDFASDEALAGGASTPTGAEVAASAGLLAERVSAFASSLGRVDWDLTRATMSQQASDAWAALVTAESLAKANVVEARIIELCGLPSRVTSVGDGPERLPDPSIPSPTATDPPTGPVDEGSEQRALGATVAALFSLEVDEARAQCLGRELSDVVDLSSAEAAMSQYLGQFQAAFDACGVDFTIPTE